MNDFRYMSLDLDIKQKILSETATIAWKDLERFYASGVVIRVEEHLDLIDVAYLFSEDKHKQIEKMLVSGEISKLNSEHAKKWHQTNPELWATVVAPWVLVQQREK